jgi:hypothetical protein
MHAADIEEAAAQWLARRGGGLKSEEEGALPLGSLLRTREVVQRTHALLPVTMFNAVAGGHTLIYATESPPVLRSGLTGSLGARVCRATRRAGG